MKHLSHLWMTETRCAYCGAQSGTVIGAGVCSRFTSPQAEKPAPLPHEWPRLHPESNMLGCYSCLHCGEPLYKEQVSKPCPARTEPPAECDCAEQRARGFHQVCDICQGPIGNDPEPAQKAEALPELPELPEVLADFISRLYNPGCVWTPNEAEKSFQNVARLLLAECRKIAREEIGKARIEFDVGHGSDFVNWQTCHARRIVPGKEGE